MITIISTNISIVIVLLTLLGAIFYHKITVKENSQKTYNQTVFCVDHNGTSMDNRNIYAISPVDFGL